MNNTSRIRPHFIENIFDTLLSVTRAAGKDVHPEFIRAIICVGQAFGITEKELANGRLDK